MIVWRLLYTSIILTFALTNNSFLFGQEANLTSLIQPKLSEDLTQQERVLVKLTPSGTTAEAEVSPKNIKIKVGTIVVWENMLPEKVYVQSKPDENHFQGELLNGSYFFPGETREERLDNIGTFVYDGSNGFGSYYVRGTITVVEEATEYRKIPVESKENQVANSSIGNGFKATEEQVQFDLEPNESSEAESYSDSSLGITLKHPIDWKLGNLKNGIQLIKENNAVYVEIRKHSLESVGGQLKQYVGDYIKDRSTSRTDFKLLNVTETTISGNLPAYKAIYTFLKTENQKDFTSGGDTNKILRIWTVAHDNAYLIAFVSDEDKYDSYLPSAEKIIDSIEFTEVQDNDDSKDNDDSDDSKDNDDSDDGNLEDTDNDGDIDCEDTDKRNFKVGPGDPGNLDGDGDGIGCEE